MPKVSEWINFFKNIDLSSECLRKEYGSDYNYIDNKRVSILELLNLHLKKFGNNDIIIARVPGRINLMGRHVDHQGSTVNLIAIDKEIFITGSLRTDHRIIAYNYNEKLFKNIDLDFSTLNSGILDNWNKLIKNDILICKLRSPKGSWENYLKAAYFRLANLVGLKKTLGANICVYGNLIIAAGLSSSSALTMGIFEVLIKLNNIKLENNEIINLSAQAEWFVGTRGGSSDQIAIKLSKTNQIAHVKLFDLEILERIDFPDNCEIMVCNTNIIADKSGSKMDLYNQKVLAYEIGFALIKNFYPEYAKKLRYLRDLDDIGLSSKELIKMLLILPEYIKFNEIPKFLGKKWKELEKKYVFNEIPKQIPIRKIIAYGISECRRSKSFIKFIKNQNIS
ncbi:MAG: galactokinase family protein, partial [Candidatus Hermodarchaeota archaeon]